MVHKGGLQVRVGQVQRDVMNDPVATEDQEQPAGCHQRKARVADRDPGHRTSSGPADICSAPTEAGHMTAANQIVRSAKKVLAMEGRPHMTTFEPILISLSLRLVSDQSLIGSGVPSVRRKLPDCRRAHGAEGGRRWRRTSGM